MLNFLKRLALIGATGAVAATSLVGVTVPAQAASAGWAVALAAVPPATTVGSSVTLDAVASQNVGPTPYYIEIFDQTTLSFLGACGSGDTCSATVTQYSATTHTYIAFVSSFDTNYVPTNAQAGSNSMPVTWTNVPQPPSVGGPSGASTLCNGGTQVINQNTEGVLTKLYTLSPSSSELDVCVRVEENGFGLGGEFVVREPSPSVGLPGLGAPSTDSNFTACQTTQGNTVPGFHPMEQGSVAGIDVLFDAYANASTAWVCLWLPAAQTRLVVPIPQPSVNVGPLPSVSFIPDPGTP